MKKQLSVHQPPQDYELIFSRNIAGQKERERYMQSNERVKSIAKITLLRKDLIQDWWRKQKLYRQTTLQQTSFTTNAKWTSIGREHEKERHTKQAQNN